MNVTIPATSPLPVAADPLEDACGTDPAALCEWVFEHTGDNHALAVAVDWLVGRPLAIVGVILGAWVAARLARRLVRRGVRRMLVPPELVRKQIDARRGQVLDDQRAAIEQARRAARSQSIGAAIGSSVSVLIWVIAAMWVAGIIGIDLAPLLASAGIVGVALGFGSQSLVRDTLNGVFMLIEDQYGIGDSVDLGTASGTVERISLRTTVLRGVDGTVWHVPNGEVRRVGNRSQLWSVAVVDVEVAYSADIVRAQAVMHEAAVEVCDSDAHRDDVLEPPEVLGVESLGTDRVTLRLVVKTTPGRQWALQRALRQAITLAFDARGVAIPVTQLPAVTPPGTPRPPETPPA